MTEWSVEFYTLENEESPVADWYAAQGSKVQAKLLWTFELLEELGIEVGMPHVKPLGDKLYEVRVRVDRNNFRVIYFAYTIDDLFCYTVFRKRLRRLPPRN
jgi:phage-related protein